MSKTRDERVQKVASIITDYWPHRMSTAAAKAIDDFYKSELLERLYTPIVAEPAPGKHRLDV